MTNAVAKREDKAPADPLRQAVDKMAPEFKAALPAHVPVDKFVRVAMTAINADPNLRNADRRSLFGSVTKLAQDGLLPDGREAALVIFNSKVNGEWVKKVQAMPMISGLLKMMRQSGEVAWVDAQIVREGDHFQYRPGLDEMPIFEPDWFGDRGPVIGAYAVAKLKSGEVVPPEIMNLQQIEEVRNVSRAKDRGPWVDWFDQMALKTVLRRYLKRLPTSTDLMGVFDRDETMATTIEHQPVTLRAVDEPAENVSRLDALEHRIEEEEADETVETENAEEAEIEEVEAEVVEPEPAYAKTVRKIERMIDKAKEPDDITAADAEFQKHAAALPDDVASDLDGKLAAARTRVREAK